MPTLFDRYQDPNLTSDWAQVGVTNFFSDEKSIGFTTNQNLQDPQTQFISIAGQTSYGISDNSSIRLSVGGITWPGPTFGTGQIGGRHGGTVGSPESIPPTPPHDIEHSLYDVGAGENSTQISGRHGGTEGAPDSIPPIPSHDIEHSIYDNGAGINNSLIGGRYYDDPLHPAQATGGEVMDIMTPGERLGGVDVNRVQPVYTPISQILGDPDALF